MSDHPFQNAISARISSPHEGQHGVLVARGPVNAKRDGPLEEGMQLRRASES